MTIPPPTSLDTIGKLVGIFYTFSLLQTCVLTSELRELTQQLKTVASRLVAGLEELWKGCRTINGAGSEGGSADGLVSSLADYFDLYGDQVMMNVIQDAAPSY